MRATLVRFGPDLFEELKAEAERSGVSVAQFVREAVVARIAYTAGRRGDGAYATSEGERVRAESRRVRSEAVAVRAESRQAAKHARERTSSHAAGR